MRRRLALVAPFTAAWPPHGRGQPAAAGPEAVLVLPGPRGSVSLPFELAQRLRLDAAVGLPLRLRFVGGGGVAIRELRSGNAEFAVYGLPAMLRANLEGGPPMVALAAVDDLPLYTLVVRSDLRGRVRSVADLAGRTIGVHSSSLQSRTTSHQLAELLLRRHGVDPAGVRLLAAGQSWETQAAALLSRSVDASMCDEPFATRMEAEGLGFKLFSTGNPDDARRTPGAGFLRAMLCALRERVGEAPDRAARMVQLVQRTLAWIAGHPPEATAERLAMTGGERDAFLAVARAYPRQYSADGRFSAAQLAETELFFRASNVDLPGAANLRVEDMVVDRWAGRKP